MQELTFKFNADQVNIILAGLNELPQKVSRALSDYIVNTANEQIKANEEKAGTEGQPAKKGAK